MAEFLAIMAIVITLAGYQIQVNKDIDKRHQALAKEMDSRLDVLAIGVYGVGFRLESHIVTSAANQEVLEEKINASKAVLTHSIGVLDEKMDIITQILKDHFPSNA